MLLRKAVSCRILVVLVSLAVLPVAAAIAGEGEGWISDLEQAKKLAAESDKPIFIDFFATWCPPCKMLDSQTFSDEGVKKLLGEKFVTARIDVDKDKTTSGAYRVAAMPTLMVTDAEGSELTRHTGFIPPKPMKEFLSSVLKFIGARKAYAKDPKDTKALLTVAVMCEGYTLPTAEKLKLVVAALKVVPENDKQPRGKLLLMRGRALASDEETVDDALKDFLAAAKLDQDNALGIRETADWALATTNFDKTQDAAAFTKAINKFVADYPAGKIKDTLLRRQALIAQFQILARHEEFAGAIRSLEALKVEYGKSMDVAKVDELIKRLQAELKKKTEAANKPEGDPQKKSEGGQEKAAE